VNYTTFGSGNQSRNATENKNFAIGASQLIDEFRRTEEAPGSRNICICSLSLSSQLSSVFPEKLKWDNTHTHIMCGRVNARVTKEDVENTFDGARAMEWTDIGYHANAINCGPSNTLATLVAPQKVVVSKFGIVPSYKTAYDASKDHYVAFNCRSETIEEKPTFNRCLGCFQSGGHDRGRAVVLIRGFYEWKSEGIEKKKQPYYVSRKDGKLMCVAALCDTRKDDETGTTMRSTSLLTRASKGTKLSWLHDRMPVMLKRREAVDLWLTTQSRKVSGMLNEEYPDFILEKGEDLQWHPVTPEMGKVEFQGEACVKEVVAVAKKNTQDIKSMFAKAVAKQSAEKLSRVKIDAVAATDEEDGKKDGGDEPAKKKLKL